LKYPGAIKLIIGSPLEGIESSAEAAKKTEEWAKNCLEVIRVGN